MATRPPPPISADTSRREDDPFLRLYDELHLIADRLMNREAVGHTLQPTALLNEAWLKLAGSRGLEKLDRGHYLAIAARAMRQVLVEQGRARLTAKRGGDLPPITLADDLLGVSVPLDEMIALNDALERLAAKEERLARLVELRFFVGLDEEECAEALGVTTRTVQRDWAKARAWLQSELDDEGAGSSP